MKTQSVLISVLLLLFLVFSGACPQDDQQVTAMPGETPRVSTATPTPTATPVAVLEQPQPFRAPEPPLPTQLMTPGPK